jgi:hypothetical protein
VFACMPRLRVETALTLIFVKTWFSLVVISFLKGFYSETHVYVNVFIYVGYVGIHDEISNDTANRNRLNQSPKSAKQLIET